MNALSQILLRLAYQDSRREYGLLCRAIEEAAAMQPAPPSMDALCRRLADAGGGQEDLLLRLTRAVDRLWADPDVRLAFGQCGLQAPAGRPAPEDLISTAARHLRKRSLQAEEPPLYEISFDAASRKYGIIVRGGGAGPAVSLPALTEELRRLERVVRFLHQYRIPLELLKDDYLSGRMQRELR